MHVHTDRRGGGVKKSAEEHPYPQNGLARPFINKNIKEKR